MGFSGISLCYNSLFIFIIEQYKMFEMAENSNVNKNVI